MTIDPVTAASVLRMRRGAYWTARGLDAQASGQPCGCDPVAGHLCERHRADYEEFVWLGREPNGWVVDPPMGFTVGRQET